MECKLFSNINLCEPALDADVKFIRLIDCDEFIGIDKMLDEDKNMLPLKRINDTLYYKKRSNLRICSIFMPIEFKINTRKHE